MARTAAGVNAAPASQSPGPGGCRRRRGGSRRRRVRRAPRRAGRRATARQRRRGEGRAAAGMGGPSAAPRAEDRCRARAADRPVRDAGEREEEAGDGACERAQRREREAEPGPCPLEREDRAEREGDAERERQAADEQVGGGAHGEEQRAAASLLGPELAHGDPFEEDRRGDRRQRPDDAHPEQRAERREEDRVRGHVVAAVPGEVEDRPALALEQAAAVDLRREVGRRRPEREPREREGGREHPGSDAGDGHRLPP